MSSGNPLHHTTRTVRLPDTWANEPRDVQVNYYNYLSKRLIYSTDVYIGDRLAYRTNAIACRGDDLEPGQPVIGVFGDDFVHGDLTGSFVSEIHIAPCRILNAGIENVPLKSAIDRLNELSGTVPMVAAVFVPPRRELIPELNRMTNRLEGDWESSWEAEFDRIKGPPITVMIGQNINAPAQLGEDSQPILDRFSQFLQDYCGRKKITLLIPGVAPSRLATFGRALGFGPKIRPGQHPIAALIEDALTKRVLAFLKANPQIGASATQEAQALTGAHGPEDVGRNYPLW